VDDLMSSHINKHVNDKFLKWLYTMYSKYREVKGTRGNKHDYLGMEFEFKDKKVVIDMIEYMEEMLDEFPVKFHKNAIVLQIKERS